MIGLIARREFSAQLQQLSFWATVAISQLLVSWLLLAQLQAFEKVSAQLAAQQSTLGIHDLVISPTLNTLALLVLLLMPLFHMGSIASERRQQRLPWLLASGVKAWQLVLGKWLGLQLASALLIAVSFSSLLWLGSGVTLNLGLLGMAFVSLLMLSFFSGALSLLASSLSQQAAGALAISYAVLLSLWLFDSLLDSHTPLYPLALGPYLQASLSGQWHLASLLYWIGGSAALLLTTSLHLAALQHRHGLGPWRRSLNALLLLGCLLLGLQLSAQRPALIQAGEPLAPAWHEAIAAIQGPLIITAYAPELPLLRRQIEKSVAPILQHHPKAQLRFIDPQQQPQLARDQGIQGQGELIIEAMEGREHLREPNRLNLLGALNRLARRGEPWILFIQGHGEADPNDSSEQGLSGMASALRAQGFKPIALDIEQVSQVPANVAVAIVAGANQAFSPAAQKALQRYLQTGGALLWLHEGGGEQTLSELLPLRVLEPQAEQQTLPAGAAPFARFSSLMFDPYALQTRDDTAIRLSPAAPQHSMFGLADGSAQTQWVVLGDSDLARNLGLRRAQNQALVMQLVHWLSGNQLATSAPATDLQMHWSASTASWVAAWNLLLLPALLGLIGWQVRRARQR